MSKRNLSIVSLALGVVVMAAWWFTLKPQQEQSISDLENDLQRLEVQLGTLSDQRSSANNQIPTLVEEVEELRATVSEFRRLIPEQNNLPGLLAQLNSISDRNAVQYRGIQQGSQEQLVPGLYQVEYSLTTVGLFNDQVNFIADLQDLERWIVVDAINFTGSGSDPRRPMINATITFRTFVNGDLPSQDDEEE